MRSNESIPRPGSLFQQKVIAKVIVKVIAKAEHFDDQERKEKRNVEQKGQLKNKRKRLERNPKGTKEEERDKSNNKEIERSKLNSEVDSKSNLM